MSIITRKCNLLSSPSLCIFFCSILSHKSTTSELCRTFSSLHNLNKSCTSRKSKYILPWSRQLRKSHSVGKKIPCLLWNPNIHKYVNNIPQAQHVLSQFNPVHIITPYFFKNNFNIMIPFITILRKHFWLKLVRIFLFLHAYYVTSPIHSQ
jgi:hypothetical protein